MPRAVHPGPAPIMATAQATLPPSSRPASEAHKLLPALPSPYGVRAIPTMILFKGGQVAETLVGMMPKAALKAKLATHVA